MYDESIEGEGGGNDRLILPPKCLRDFDLCDKKLNTHHKYYCLLKVIFVFDHTETPLVT